MNAGMESFTPDEIRVLVKLASAQKTLVEEIDRVNIHDLLRKLQNSLANRKPGSGVMDMSISSVSNYPGIIGESSFKLRFRPRCRVAIIKIIREQIGVGLKEAKDITDLGFDADLEWNEILFTNANEHVYNRFKHAWDNPSMDYMYGQRDFQDMFNVTPVSPVGPA